MSAGTFVLGVGAQKAGTTWLFHYLASSPTVSTVIKEYHVWDALFTPLCSRFLVSAKERYKNRELQLRWALQNDPAEYFKFFAHLLRQPGKSVTCDITPSYCSLDATVFKQIVEGFALHNIEVKAVFLMRDPVERCWSYARMRHRMAGMTTPLSESELLAFSLGQESELRTRYNWTLAELRQAFPMGRLYTGLYEELGASHSVGAMSAFCGIVSRPNFAEKRVNQGNRDEELPLGAATTIARHYRDVYDFAEREFPRAKLLWPGYQYL